MLVFVVFGLTAFNIYHNRFGRTKHDYHVGDMVSMQQASEDLSSIFCRGYQVETFNKTFFYLLPHQAQIDPNFRRSSHFDVSTQPGHGTMFMYRLRQLLQESTVNMQACRHMKHAETQSDVPAEFAVIRGKADFEEWKKHYNSRHFRNRATIPKDASCDNSSSSLPTLNFTVLRSDIFYFLLIVHQRMSRHQAQSEDITLSVSMNMTRYNLNASVDLCNASHSSCVFQLDWGSEPDVVAWVRDRDENVDKSDIDASFVTDCNERLAFWLPVFGAIPVVIVILTSVCCTYVLVINRSVESRYRRQPDVIPPSRSTYGAIGQEEESLLGSEDPIPTPPEDDDGRASIQD